MTPVWSDERNGYNRDDHRQGWVHRSLDHSSPKSTSARDDDGDGVGA
jgi:hypothetical protein